MANILSLIYFARFSAPYQFSPYDAKSALPIGHGYYDDIAAVVKAL